MSFAGFGTTSTPAATAGFGTSGSFPSFGTGPAAGGTTNMFGGGNTTSAFGTSGGTNAFGGGGSWAFGSTPTTNSFGNKAGTTAFGPSGTTTSNMFGSFGQNVSGPSFASNALAGGFGGTQGAAAGASQQHQWVGGQRLFDISMAYASKVDASGKPIAVSTEKDTSLAPASTQQPAAQPAATSSWSFSMPTATTATPAATAPSINKHCEFEVIMYNPSSNYKQKAYTRPPHVGYRRWLQADRDNPDPDNLTPVLVVGCDGLKRRFSNQCNKAEKLKGYVDGLKEQLELLERSVDGSALRHEELKERQRKYFMRLLQVMRKLEVLRAKGIGLTPIEARYREKVDELNSAIMVPYEKIQSLESSQAILERQSETFALPSVVSEADLDSLCTVLAKQRDGLKHLTDIVKKDARDITIMEKIIRDSSTGYRYL